MAFAFGRRFFTLIFFCPIAERFKSGLLEATEFPPNLGKTIPWSVRMTAIHPLSLKSITNPFLKLLTSLISETTPNGFEPLTHYNISALRAEQLHFQPRTICRWFNICQIYYCNAAMPLTDRDK